MIQYEKKISKHDYLTSYWFIHICLFMLKESGIADTMFYDFAN